MPTSEVQVDGVLKQAYIVEIGEHAIAFGLIHGDRLGRWPDGHPIRTSAIQEGPDEQGVIRTLNSVYRLELEDPE